MSTPEVRLTTGCDHSVDVQHAVAVSRAAICASSGEGSLLEGYTWTVDIKGAAIVSRNAFVASSGKCSLLFRGSRHGNSRGRGHVVKGVPRGMKQHR